MTIHEWLRLSQETLRAAEITTARLDALVLLEDCLHTDRAQLLAHPEQELRGEQLGVLDAQIKRRTLHEPLAYIRGKTEFYGRDFYVDHGVLEPRPESESIITLLKQLHLPGKPIIADIGTGSGMLAITAKLELPDAQVYAIDIDQGCLAVAKQNAKTYDTPIEFLEGNLTEPLKSKQVAAHALLCNLPYVPDSFQINPAAMREPRLAIFGGPDGLDLYRAMFTQIDKFKEKPRYILAESMPPQHPELSALAHDHGYSLQAEEDFIQLFVRE
jgi:release factor glutamine methyltransferase